MSSNHPLRLSSRAAGFLLMLTTSLAGLSALPAAAAGTAESAEEFLQRARNPNVAATWAKLDGTLQHRRRGSELVTMPVYFGTIIQPDRVTAQLILDNDEVYIIGQSRDNRGASVIPQSNSTAKLDSVGIKATDLTMGFLYYPLEQELERETISGMVECRVMMLTAPDKSESVKVWLSAEHAFPLRAEFYLPGEKTPQRTLETGGFTRRNDLYYVRTIRAEGPGWRTRIEFDADRAELGLFDPAAPAQIIRKAKP